MFNFPANLLWIPTLANGYIAALIVQVAWNSAHRVSGAWAGFEVAILIAAISLPISGLMLIGFVMWAAMRFAVRRSGGLTVSLGPLVVSALNIVAPVLLWFSLMRIVR